MVDDVYAEFSPKNMHENFSETVFPRQEAEITVLITDFEHFSLERIQNHKFELQAHYAGNIFLREEEFEITTEMSTPKWLMWGLASIIALILSILVLNQREDMPKVKLFSILKKRLAMFRRKRSVV